MKKYFLTNNSYHIVADIEIDLLIHNQIKGVLLDLDNTIVSEDDAYISPNAEEWIIQAKLQGLKLYFISNGSRRERAEKWSIYFNIPIISKARKPFPFAFRKALAQMKLKSKQTIVIGDSFHTDVLGALIMGCPYIQVASLPHPPRWWEKIIGKWIQKPY